MKVFDSVHRLEGVMTFHRARHAVLAGNVANVDTPGYKPLDLEQIDPSDPAIVHAQVATTHPQHVGAPREMGLIRSFDDSGQSQSGDGNAVNLERELAKIDANRVRYATTSELVSRRFALLRYAAADGSSQ